MNRRSLVLGSAATVAVLSCELPSSQRAAAAAMISAEDALYAQARKEGTVVWWGAPYPQGTADAVRQAFVAKYPGVDVQFIRQTAEVVHQKLNQDLAAGVHEVDVICVSDEPGFAAWKKLNVLAPYVPLGIDVLPKAFRSIDPDQTYHVGAIGFVIIDNSPKAAPPPRSWQDLLAARWQNQLTIGHPAYSGHVGQWVVAMTDRYGWDYFTKLAKLNPKIGRSINESVTDIVSGERLAGAGPDNYTLEMKAAGNPVEAQFPTDGAILVIAPVAVVKDAPHPNAGRLFASFMYSNEYSQVLAKHANYPLRSDVPAPSGTPLDRVKYLRNSVAHLETALPEAIAKWRETFGV